MFSEIFDFLDDMIVASILIVFSCVFHAIVLDRVMNALGKEVFPYTGRDRAKDHLIRIFAVTFTVLIIFMVITVDIWAWALTYYQILHVPELKTLEDAVYFSTVTFTTLGYGDIVLKDDWRVLSGIEAANGIILLGWSTAFLFDVITLLYPRPRHHRPE